MPATLPIFTTPMKLLRRRSMLAAMCTTALPMHEAWSVPAASPDIGELLAQGRYRQAARQLLAHVATQNPDVAEQQAVAGFIDDAMRTVAPQPAWRQQILFLTMARRATAAPLALRAQWLQRAEALVDPAKSASVAATNTAFLVLGWMALQREDQAQAALKRALELARRGLSEPNSAGYFGITSALASLPDEGLTRRWMIQLIHPEAAQAPQLFQRAQALNDLATLASRLRFAGMATGLRLEAAANAGKVEAKALRTQLSTRISEDALAQDDHDFARAYPAVAEAGMAQYPAYLARQGREQEAIAALSRLGDGLYVNHRGAALRTMIHQALQRSDFDVARRYLELDPSQGIPDRIELLRLTSAWHRAKGEVDDARRVATQALGVLDWKKEHEVFIEELRPLARLRAWQTQAGWAADARATVALAARMQLQIPRRRTVDCAASAALVAREWVAVGGTQAAGELLRAAFQEAWENRQEPQARHRLQALAEIAVALASLGEATGARRPATMRSTP